MRSVQFGFFLSFFPAFFFFFYRYFPCRQYFIRWDVRGNRITIFLVFHFQPLTNIHLVHWDFYHLFLLDLFVITRLIADETCLLRYLHFICIFIDAIKSELLTLTFQSDIVRIWVHIKLSPFYCKANALTNWNLHPYPPLSICHIYPALPLAITCPLTVSQNV